MAHEDAPTIDRRFGSAPGKGAEVRGCSGIAARAGEDGLRHGMLAPPLHGGGEAQHFIHRKTFSGTYRPQFGHARGDGPGLIQNHGIDGGGKFEDVAALDEQTAQCTAAGAGHDGGRRRKSHGARAGDDEHGHRVQQRVTDRAEKQPGRKGNDRDRENSHREVAAHRIGEAGDRSARTLRPLHEFHDARQSRFAAHMRGTKTERAGAVQRAAEDGRRYRFRYRETLTGQHRLIDVTRAVEHRAIHRNTFAGLHDDHIADNDIGDGNDLFGAAGRAADHAGSVRGEADQPANGVRRFASHTRFQQTTQQHENDNDGGGFEIDILRAGPDGPYGIKECRAGAEGDQRIHVGRTMPQRRPGIAIIGLPAVQQHRQGQDKLHQRQPIEHRQHHYRSGQQSSDHDATAQIHPLLGFGKFLRPLRDLVARFFHGGDEIGSGGDLGTVGHLSDAGGQVDGGAFHAGRRRELFFNGSRAGGAGHPADGQLDLFGRSHRLRHSSPIANLFDGTKQRIGRSCFVAEFHDGAARCESDFGRGDAGHAAEFPADGADAGVAGHAIDFKDDFHSAPPSMMHVAFSSMRRARGGAERPAP